MKLDLENFALNKSLMKLNWKYGFGSFYRRVFNGVSIIILSAFVGNLIVTASDPVVPTWTKAWTMMTRCTSMGSMVALGTGQGMSMLVTYYWNSNQKHKALETTKIGFISIVISSFLVAALLLALSPVLFGDYAYKIDKDYRSLGSPIGIAYLLAVIYLIPMSIQMGPLLIYSGMQSPNLSWRHTTMFNSTLILVTLIFFIAEAITKQPLLLFIGIAVGSILGLIIVATFFKKRYKGLFQTNI